MSKPTSTATAANGRVAKTTMSIDKAEKNEQRGMDLDMDCRGCGSEKHTPYTLVRDEVIDGNLITWKRTQCTHCAQWRINRFISPAPNGPGKPGERRR